jgi:hypothetical protein
MTMPDAASSSKTPRRWGLYAPYVLLLLAIIAWSVFWLVMRSQLQAGLVRQAAALRTAGYEVSWAGMKIGGYPFRLEVELAQPRIADPNGWGLAAPRLQAEANAYGLDHWVLVAPDGLTLERPALGAVTVRGQALRASIAGLGAAPRIAFEGDKLTFLPPTAPGAQPFAFTAIDRVEFHLREIAGDRAQFQLTLAGAQTRRVGVLARIAPLAPMALTLQTELSKVGGFAGRDWSGGVRAWTAEGGQAQVRQLLVSVGDLSLKAWGGPLTVDADGRLQGDLDLSLKQDGPALALLGAGRGDGLRLHLAGGEASVGPIRIGPAPRVF